MKTTLRRSIRLSLSVTLILSALVLMSCTRPRVSVIPADRMLKSLPNGNYEVTPAWLQERYKYERWAQEQLKGCK